MLARGFTPHSFANIATLKRGEQKIKNKNSDNDNSFCIYLSNKENETEGN